MNAIHCTTELPNRYQHRIEVRASEISRLSLDRSAYLPPAPQSSMSPAIQTVLLASPGEIRVPLRLSSMRSDWGKLLALAAG